MKVNLMERLEANSTWEPNSGCRIWLGSLKRDHGEIKVRGKVMAVHRLAWEMERGPIPKGLWVLHNCGLAPCFNVNHLRLGTQLENAQDRHSHGGYVGRVGGGTVAIQRVVSRPIGRLPSGGTIVLDHNSIRQVLTYDPAAGVLRWNVRADRDRSWNMRHSGEIAGGKLSSGYRQIVVDAKHYLEYRVIWFWMTGKWPDDQVDHINGKRDDNRWVNLRLATQTQNSANQGLRTDNTSGVKGVSWDKKKNSWIAMITVGRKQKFLGYSKTLEGAIALRRTAELELHGDFARTEGTA